MIQVDSHEDGLSHLTFFISVAFSMTNRSAIFQYAQKFFALSIDELFWTFFFINKSILQFNYKFIISKPFPLPLRSVSTPTWIHKWLDRFFTGSENSINPLNPKQSPKTLHSLFCCFIIWNLNDKPRGLNIHFEDVKWVEGDWQEPGFAICIIK